MTRWYVGVRSDGRPEVFADTTGTYGPYRTQHEATKAVKSKPSPERGPQRNRRRS